MRALLVEDDTGLAAALVQALRAQGWRVLHAATGRSALEHLDAALGGGPDDAVDLVLLDMGLPDHDGLWVCQQVRARSGVPIVAVTARRSEAAVVGALRAGVDDYVTKPYSLAVLLARMEAVLRRSRGRAGEEPVADLGFAHDRAARAVRLPDGTRVALTAKESELLGALARTPGDPVTRAALMEEVWDTTWVGASRTLDVHVAALRAKLGPAVPIETVRGIGYRLAPRDGAPPRDDGA
ncbi:response regulator transcription factor [Nocardioides sp. ChNu-153]|uniref:response regulator transcription factor n=1 Tax=unclassified Nocardioides TaxID=2615069 RepID=UPI0024057A23|nr:MULTISPECIES: response regulator transcription factor [unclassified Nocardioides]MDF9715530.1 response regulator transcription factor [Nocardioides sp. ChNu-99]MDN7120715.1 response regulator transcription factor [Nocardioides sp. ChNu-153]